ncbi:sensor histidine kinase [Catellatospora tritici]|uniref:sensor histidine kinase n=1 Tax=Catellatospora tritici TaxID=2851566 RepID=UPI001C2D62B2|nr:histidine kinase [Catellatospora tritici]MBV1850616.1 sensor domain-containing protein [Catellatospora tritici]
MTARTALSAATAPPWRLLATGWPWRSVAYLLAGAIPAALPLALLIGIDLLRPDLTALLVLLLLALLVVIGAGPLLVAFERRSLRLADPRPLPPRPPLRLRDAAAWREIGYAVLNACVTWWLDLAVIGLSLFPPLLLMSAPLQPSGPTAELQAGPWLSALLAVAGLVLLPLAAYPITAWAGVRAAITRTVLAPSDTELVEVLRSRERLVDGFEAERRRIERDLHDGAQQRLVALSVTLGLARLRVADADAVAPLLDDAREQTALALTELRELIRGVHPQILSDRGLAAALRDIAGRSPVPVDLELRLAGRLPAPVEAAAYFAANEALANIARHSGAARGRMSAWTQDRLLLLEIADDGTGGADPARGTGLTGLADRIAATGGRLLLASPAGGPTLLRVELPCQR